jgi:hypothetical protein
MRLDVDEPFRAQAHQRLAHRILLTPNSAAIESCSSAVPGA